MSKALDLVRSRPFLDSVVTSSIASIPVIGSFLSTWYTESGGSSDAKTAQILQILTSLQEGNEEQFSKLSQLVAARGDEILQSINDKNFELVDLIKAAQSETNAKLDELLVLIKKPVPLSYSQYIDKGRELFRAGDFQSALDCYDGALALDPLSAVAWMEKAKSFYRLGKMAEAEETLEKALKLDSGNAEAWTLKGWSLRRLREAKEGIRCFDKAIRLNPLDSDAWAGKGWCLRDLGRSADAITCFDEALKSNPRSVDALAGKGWALLDSGKRDEANKLFDETLAVNPKNSDALDGKKRLGT